MRRLLVLGVLAVAALVPASAHALVPNDPGWAESWAQRVMRLPEVWDYTTGDPSVIIASIDTGVKMGIPDLAGALVPGHDFVHDRPDMDDIHGHGTLVASEMVARGNNGIAIAGYCWECRLMPVRVTGTGHADFDMVGRGIRWAVDHGARVINVGLAGETAGTNVELREAVEYAAQHDVLVVASAGNTENETLVYPGAFPSVLAVAATDRADRLYSWSTRGPWVELAAPGYQPVISIFDTWGWLDGSSFSAPAVTAVAALALSLKPQLSAEAIAEALKATAVPIPGVAHGRVDAFATLERLGAIPAKKPITTTRETRILFGKVRRLRAVTVTVGRGRLDVVLNVRSKRPECVMSTTIDGDIVLARRRGRLLRLSTAAPPGRYVFHISCRTRAAKEYALTITAPTAARATASRP